MIGFLLLSAAAAAWSYQRGGTPQVLAGLTSGAHTLVTTAPLMVMAFIVTGMVQALVRREAVERLLGEQAGFKGILLGALAGALIPGGPYVYYPLALSFLRYGAGVGTLFAFIAAKNLWSVSRIPIEVALIGPQVTFVRYLVTFPIPIVLGVLASVLLKGQRDRLVEVGKR